MAYCTSCGQQVDSTMRFCPSCGAALTVSAESAEALTAAAVTAPVTVSPGTVTEEVSQAVDYSIVLVSCGSCSRTTARSLLQDVLHYSRTESIRLTSEIPIEIARNLTFRQALDLARMFTEYGMQVSVYNTNGYVDLGLYADQSVFSSGGTLLSDVVTTLATLTVANRVSRFLRWTHPEPLRHLFAPRYRFVPPPRYERRSLWHEPEPPRRTAARPARRSSGPEHGPGPGGGNRGPGRGR